MTQKTWNELSLFEQLSNIDGDVERMIRCHEKYLSGTADKDNGWFYYENIKKMVKMILLDTKNINRGYIAVELFDEVDSLSDYLNGECSADYIRRYWNQYTNAIS